MLNISVGQKEELSLFFFTAWSYYLGKTKKQQDRCTNPTTFSYARPPF